MTRKLTIDLGEGPVAVTDGGDVDLDAVDYRAGDGSRITNAIAEEWAKEAEQRGGRPHLDPEKQPSIRLAFRVPEGLSDRIDDLAAKTGRRRSDVLRAAVEAYLEAV
ncbi:MAG: ribbon-helix-helix protein, CopG family [Propionibacteriaceae bacterium]|nr:ribbon-helix-helix protein, CopG family [Propionibacteriaceae bacterium]